ncbi:MAG: ABC transporter substrate-binding protein [Candidatus ainarchaeum sp.]|nr:ABC transporter substrate-binding protein [Candidatus ainarchaeum sp.]
MDKKRLVNFFIVLVLTIVIVLLIIFSGTTETYKIGYVGAMTGPMAKYGSYEAVSLAIDEINDKGGISGKQIELIAEDGKCNAQDAVAGANKLIFQDGVKVILGGHCSPESLAIASLSEENKVIQLASITTSPKYSDFGDYIFRTSPSSAVQGEVISNAIKAQGYTKVAILFEKTDYAEPIAANLKTGVEKFGQVVYYDQYVTGTNDFKTEVSKIVESGAEIVFISPQAPDATLLIVKQLLEQGSTAKIFGNDVTGNLSVIEKDPTIFEGMIFTTPSFDSNSEMYLMFSQKYKEKYGVDVPYGFWTAESYDAVFIIANAINENGYDSDGIKTYLEALTGFKGSSGTISINALHDGIRSYSLRTVKSGKIVNYE